MSDRADVVRPLREADVAAAQVCGYDALREAGSRYGWQMPEPDEAARAHGRSRIAHLLATDPDGAWVAEVAGEVVGVALALRREPLWFLSLLTVAPGQQGRGLGGQLLAAALRTAADAPAGLLVSSSDPKALRRYAAAGFALQPGYDAVGRVDRALLPAGDGVRDGDWAADAERVDDLGRRLRGAAYGPDLAWLQSSGARLLVARDGFAVLGPYGIVMLGATEPRTAAALLWAGLAESGADEVEVGPLTAGQPWAVDVALAARLALRPGSSLCTRGALGPLTPYLPGGLYG